MKKKIAFLTTQYNEVISGPGRFTEYLKSLRFEAIEIHFFSQEIDVELPLEKPVSIPGWAKKIPFSSLIRAWMFSRSIQKLDQKEKYDYILAADYSMAMFLPDHLLKRTAVMVNDDNFLLIFSEETRSKKLSFRTRLSRKLGFFLERRSCLKAGLTISNSLYTSGIISKVYQIPDRKIKLLYKAVDLTFFEFKPKEEKPPRRFLFVKNDWKRGGLDLLAEAFARLDFQVEMEFIIAGILPAQQDTVKEVILRSGFKGKHRLLGLVRREQLKQLMAEADVFVNFSRQEALGVSCLEAMASGLPVLASDAGGLKEVLGFGEAGFMIQSENVDALTRVLVEMNDHPSILQEKVDEARKHVYAFSVEKLRENMDELFRFLPKHENG